MPKLTLEKVYSHLSSRITTTNKKLTKITNTIKRHDEVLKFLTHKQFETDDRFDSIDKKLESMERSFVLLPTLYDLVHQTLSGINEMRKEQPHIQASIQNHEERIVILETYKHSS